MFILLYFLFYINVVYGKIIIKDASVATMSRGDIGMIFYLTLDNMCTEMFHIYVKMIKCCEAIKSNDMDCQMMHLLGGDMSMLHPNISKNISLLYPNMYLHNRRGQCLISIKYVNQQDKVSEIIQKIAFDTMICDNKVPPTLQGYYSIDEYKKCDTVDLDPLDNCQPVNCQMKYLGCRNYFSHKWKRCQKVPVCIADPNKDLPDVAYFPVSNSCRDLEQCINENDLQYLEQGIVQGSWDKKNIPLLSANLRCHHGKLDNETGFCACNDGWTSVPFDKDQYEPSLSLYHMCNIEISTWNNVNSIKLKMTALIIAILAVAIAMILIITSFMLHIAYKCIKSYESTGPPEDSEANTSTVSETQSDNEGDMALKDIETKSRSVNTYSSEQTSTMGEQETEGSSKDQNIDKHSKKSFKKVHDSLESMKLHMDKGESQKNLHRDSLRVIKSDVQPEEAPMQRKTIKKGEPVGRYDKNNKHKRHESDINDVQLDSNEQNNKWSVDDRKHMDADMVEYSETERFHPKRSK